MEIEFALQTAQSFFEFKKGMILKMEIKLIFPLTNFTFRVDFRSRMLYNKNKTNGIFTA